LKKVKNIVVAVVVTVTLGLLLFFSSPAPEIEKGIGPLPPLDIGLSALAGVILLVIFLKNIKVIIRSVVDSLPSIITIVVASGLVLILVYVSWPAEITMKVELLRSMLIASLVLVGSVGVILSRLIRGDGTLSAKLGMSEIGITKLRTFIYRSAALGCLTLVAIVANLITGELNLFFIAWLFFILQLGLLIFPLMLAKVIIFC
jgi:hypothetical protein